MTTSIHTKASCRSSHRVRRAPSRLALVLLGVLAGAHLSLDVTGCHVDLGAQRHGGK